MWSSVSDVVVSLACCHSHYVTRELQDCVEPLEEISELVSISWANRLAAMAQQPLPPALVWHLGVGTGGTPNPREMFSIFSSQSYLQGLSCSPPSLWRPFRRRYPDRRHLAPHLPTDLLWRILIPHRPSPTPSRPVSPEPLPSQGAEGSPLCPASRLPFDLSPLHGTGAHPLGGHGSAAMAC